LAIETRLRQRQALSGRVVLVIGLAVLLNYVDRGNLATAAPLLQDELSLSNGEIGVLLSAFFWVYAPAQLLAGWLAHRFDIRIVLAAGVALWSVATALTGLAHGFASILALRLMLGLGESVTFPCWLLILARYSVEHERGRANGFVSSGQGFGPMLGTLFGGLAMAHFGWRAMFLGLGTITLLWLWPWFAVTRDMALHAADGDDPRQVSYVEILQQRGFWGVAVGQFLINYAFYFVLTWLPSFLVKAGGFTVSQMAGIGAAIYGIYAVTTALAGAVSDRWIQHGWSATRVRKMFLLVAASGSGVTIACCALVPPQAAAWFLGITAVFFGLSTPMIFAVGATLAGPRAAGRWGGAQNLAGQLAGVVSPIVTGLIVDRTGGYSLAFAMAAAAALLSMVAWGIVIRQVAAVRWSGDPVSVVEPVAHASR
jgi:MFS family permease